MSEQILVTGATGFVGRHLVEQLRTKQDSDIVATDITNPPPKEYSSDGITYKHGDITDDAFLDELFSVDYNRVYHLAAVVGVDNYLQDPLHLADVNIIATRNILGRLEDTDVRFVFMSTSEVYGKNEAVPWPEEADRVIGPPTVDRWSYSTGKGACEHMIHGLAEADSPFTATVIRPFNLYGPGQRPNFVLPAFVKEVVNGRAPKVYGDGTQTRCFTYIEDFVEGVVRASVRDAGENEVFNLGSTCEIKIRDLADLVLQIANKQTLEPNHIDPDELYGDSYEDIDKRIPDVSKAEKLLDWRAQTSLEQGVHRVIEWGRENYN